MAIIGNLSTSDWAATTCLGPPGVRLSQAVGSKKTTAIPRPVVRHPSMEEIWRKTRRSLGCASEGEAPVALWSSASSRDGTRARWASPTSVVGPE